ncbi:MAG: ATP-binding protein [Anaerolineae bacterium]|uniref:ATP-binding protein n=1 Tax=Candidatus Amarolinea dominans TaxID=3140696 RepID=UPI003136B353|nr:ATP-binding protein [Anaerolineae bacterium]
MIYPRPQLQQDITHALTRSRVVALIGPRQCGKTTLAREFVPADSMNYFDLEDPISLARLDQPMTALQGLTGLVVIDEIQRRPELFPLLRVLCDRTPLPARFLILGSASPAMLRQSSETLAGRLEIIRMAGFSLAEVGVEMQMRHWQRGGFPLSFLAASDADSLAWRRNFIQTFLERDLPQLGVSISAASMFRFWNMLAHYHGQVWNAAETARNFEVSESTVRRYLDLLEGAFMVRQLRPWFVNLGKRQIKSPKLYFRDTGILHQMLGLREERDLWLHPKSGASWEGYVIEEVIKAVDPDEAYFWATHSGAELDLLLFTGGRRVGVECKRMDAPRLTPSMRSALTDLALDHLIVLYPGERPYPLAERVTVLPLAYLAQGSQALDAALAVHGATWISPP